MPFYKHTVQLNRCQILVFKRPEFFTTCQNFFLHPLQGWESPTNSHLPTAQTENLKGRWWRLKMRLEVPEVVSYSPDIMEGCTASTSLMVACQASPTTNNTKYLMSKSSVSSTSSQLSTSVVLPPRPFTTSLETSSSLPQLDLIHKLEDAVSTGLESPTPLGLRRLSYCPPVVQGSCYQNKLQIVRLLLIRNQLVVDQPETTTLTKPIIKLDTRKPKTVQRTTQTRNVRFDRRRPQTLELRRFSSCQSVDKCEAIPGTGQGM